MNISLPVIDNMFAGVVAVGPCRSKPPVIKNTGRLFKVSADGPCLPDMPNAAKAYNSLGHVAGKAVNGLLQKSECMLRKKTAVGSRTDNATVVGHPQTLGKGSAGTKRKSKHSASGLIPWVNPAQLVSAEKSLTAAVTLGASIRARTHVRRQQQRGPQTPCKPVPLANNQGSTRLKHALPGCSKVLIATDVQQEGVKSADRAVLSTPKAAATERLVSKKPGPRSIVTVAAPNRIAALSDEKSTIVDTLPAGMRQRAHVLHERLAPLQREQPDADQNPSEGPDKSALPGDRPAIAGTMVGVVKQKAQVLDDRFPQFHEKSADAEQKTSVGPKKSAFSVEKTADNPAPVSREPKPNLVRAAGQILSESVHGKEQAGSLLRKSFSQQLNATESQVPTGQAKDRGRPTYGNGSSIHFTRVFSSYSTHIPVSELPLGSTQTTKVAHYGLPGHVSSTMSEQIMESIRGSLQQGDRCITSKKTRSPAYWKSARHKPDMRSSRHCRR